MSYDAQMSGAYNGDQGHQGSSDRAEYPGCFELLDRILLNIGTEAEIEITEFVELTDPDLYEEIFNILFPQAMVVSPTPF